MMLGAEHAMLAMLLTQMMRCGAMQNW